MNKISVLSIGTIETISYLLGECVTGTEITNFLEAKDIKDNSGESTKWKRLNSIFINLQKKDKCANRVLDMSATILDPALFIDRRDVFEEYRQRFNKILVLSGLEYKSNGKFCKCTKANTLEEADKRVKTIRSKFRGRNIHLEVLKYCKAELMQDNLFHAVFEASKGLAERIREMSKIDKDGVFLVDQVFSIDKPVLAFNKLESETEKSEHKGFASLLKGCFSAFRNPPAHQPKVLWKGDEEDIIDCFSLISFLHRKLDNCYPTHLRKQ